MKRNKIILAVLILNMIALIFSGCGGGNPVVPLIDNGDGDEEELKFWDGSFANKKWIITTGTNGPEAYSNLVYCSDSLDNVWVDDQDRLHLKITYDNANPRWNCAQIGSKETFGGYGKYTFYIDNVIMKMANGEESTVLDKNVVIGLYTYDNDSSHPSKNEIDLEFSQWGTSYLKEGWFIVWEDASPGQLERDRCNFPIQLVGKSSVHSFDWTENSIDFKSASGDNIKTAHYPSIIDFNDFGDLEGDGYIPQPQNEKVLMNIWLTGGQPYSDNMKSAEIIISSFEFDRDEQTQNHPPDITSSPVTSATKGQPYNYDVDATDPDVGDIMTYSLTTKPSGMTINSSSGVIAWTPSSTGDYDVTAKVSDGELFDTQSFTINVDNDEPSTLSAPSIIIASQGTSDWNIFVSWNYVTGATYYQLYRATSETGIKTLIENWTYNFYTDIDVSPGVHYFYFVKAATDSIGSNASDYSDSAEGWKAGSNLVLPTIYDPGSSVNSGTPYTVSWSDESADGAEKYRIFEIESTATSGTLYTVYGTSKEFKHSVSEDTTYLYKVGAYSNGGWSDYSEQVDMIVKAESTPEMFPAPTLYPIQLEGYEEVGYPETTKFMIFTLSWSNVVGADIYNIEWAIDSFNPSNFDTHNPNHNSWDWPDLLSETIAREMDSSSHIFYWRVRAESFPSGKIGYWSNIQSIYCPSIDEVFGTGD